MKKTKSGQSKTEDLYELIMAFSPEEVDRFRQFARRKKEEAVYLELFDFMRKLFDKENLQIEQIREAKIRNEMAVSEAEKPGRYQSLCRNLYRSLLAFMAEERRKGDNVAWRQKVTAGLDEVEVLASKLFFKQAASRLAQVQKLIPERREGYVWADMLPVTRFVGLKFWLKDKVDFLALTKDDQAIKMLHHFSSTTSQLATQPIEKDFFRVLGLDAENMFFFRLIHEALLTKKDDKKRIELLDRVLKRFSSRKKEILAAIKQRQGEDAVDSGRLHLMNILIYRYSLDKALLLLQAGELEEAFKELERFRNSAEGELNLATMMLLAIHQQELGLSRMIRSKSKEIPLFDFTARYLYTERLIEDLPVRLELNEVLVKAYMGDFQEARKRVGILIKKRSGNTAWKPFIIEFKIMEAILHFEAATTRSDFDSDTLRRLNDAVKNHDGTLFERSVMKILNALGQWASDRHSQQHYLKEHLATLEALKKARNESNPLHQFVIHWLDKIQEWKQTR